MRVFLVSSVLLFAACGSDSRSDECEIDGCDQTIVDACIALVEACEDADVSTTICVDAAIDANAALCGAGDTDS